jgi:hypothetical protein
MCNNSMHGVPHESSIFSMKDEAVTKRSDLFQRVESRTFDAPKQSHLLHVLRRRTAYFIDTLCSTCVLPPFARCAVFWAVRVCLCCPAVQSLLRVCASLVDAMSIPTLPPNVIKNLGDR